MKFNKRKVSPVIAVLIVATVVVLAAVAYVMMMDRSHPEVIPVAPLGLLQENKTTSSVTIKISSAPNGATTDGASISYIHNGTLIPLTAKLYDVAGSEVAHYDASGFNATVPLTKGMTLVITPTLPTGTSVSDGDLIVITSNQHTFATSTVRTGPRTGPVILPLGLKEECETEHTVTIEITIAPNGATTEGASISYTHYDKPTGATATLYDVAGSEVAHYDASGFNATVPLTKGMTLVVEPDSSNVSLGDVITISSSQNTFGTTTLTVS